MEPAAALAPTTPAAAAPASKPTTPITATRGAWYKLEQLALLGDVYTNRHKAERACKLVGFLRRHNTTKITGPYGEQDLDKQMVRTKEESDLEFATKGKWLQDQWALWQDEPLTIAFTDKRKALVMEGLDWVFKPGNRVKSPLNANDQHTLSLLQAFDTNSDDEGNDLQDD